MTSRAELRDIFERKLDRYIGTIDFHLRELERFGNILDSGAGTGNLTLELLKEGHAVTAVDLDYPSLEILRKKCLRYEGLDVRKMDVQSLDFEGNKFDGASSMFVIPLVKDIRAYVSGVYGSLREGGKFSISAWAPVKDSWYRVVEHPREELTRKGILPKYQKEFDALVKSTREFVDVVLNGPNLSELKKILFDVGFKNIKNYDENPCKGYAYFLTCEK